MEIGSNGSNETGISTGKRMENGEIMCFLDYWITETKARFRATFWEGKFKKCLNY